MVYKKYVMKNGKLHGPYYYESYRDGDKIRKRYIGTSLPSVKKLDFNLFLSIGVVVLLIIGIFFLINTYSTPSVVLSLEPSYGINESLGGSVSLRIESGDRISKDSMIELTLKNGNEIVAQTNESVESFMAGQTEFETLEDSEERCENITLESINEVCVDSEDGYGQICNNETSTSIEENCTSVVLDSGDYYTQQGVYSREIADFFLYSFRENGDYTLEFRLDDYNLSEEESFSIDNINESLFAAQDIMLEAQSLSPGNVTSCGSIDSPGYYVMNQSITTGLSTCIAVNSDNVFFDGKGFSLNSDIGSQYGLDVRYVNNVTILNVSIFNYTTGVWINSLDNSNFSYITVIFDPNYAGTERGFLIRGIDYNNNTFSNLVAINYTTGFDIATLDDTSSGNTFDNLIAEGVCGNIGLDLAGNWGHSNFNNFDFTTANACSLNIQSLYNATFNNITTYEGFSSGDFENVNITNLNLVDLGGYVSVRFLDSILLNGTFSGFGITMIQNQVYSTGLFNVSANVTLYSVLTNFSDPVIFRTNGAYSPLDICSQTSYPSCYNFTSLNAGTVIFNVSSWSGYKIGERSLFSFPVINISYPLNTTYNVSVSQLNYSAFDENGLDSCWYSLDNGETNNSVVCGENVTGLDSGYGTFSWRVYANTTYGVENSSSVYFRATNESEVSPSESPTNSRRGGAATNETIEVIEECKVNYECGSWSACSDIDGKSVRTRICKQKCGESLKVESSSCEGLCVPNWKCGSWSACGEEGFSQRACVDLNNCGSLMNKPIGVVKCNQNNCESNVSCSVDECNYDSLISDSFTRVLRLNGVGDGICSDRNGCIENYSESISCNSGTDLSFVKQKECGKEFVYGLTKDSSPVMKISIDSWKQDSKLNLLFVQNKSVYCGSCYNGIMDSNEQGVDCGGDCSPCLIERKDVADYIRPYTAGLIALPLFILFFLWRKRDLIAKIRKLIREGKEDLRKGNKKEARAKYNLIEDYYSELNLSEKKLIKKEIEGYHKLLK